MNSAEMVARACGAGVAIPAFNVPYLPMTEPVIRAVIDQDSLAFIETARLEWYKFEAHSPAAVMEEFNKWADLDHVRLHLDHVPVIDEDGVRVDYLAVIREALGLGYHSVMVDGSRLSLGDNIDATRRAAEMAHEYGVPCEAELGAVLGHESGPLPPYEELYASGLGFTSVDEAERFVRETGCDWLSVAVGSIHGAISGAAKDKKKVEARLNLARLEQLHQTTGIPLVLHGGSGVKQAYLLPALTKGITKVNVATEIRQAYEQTLAETGSVPAAQDAVYERTTWLLRDYFRVAGTHSLLADAGA